MNPLNLRTRMTLAELNARDREAFVETLGWIFEDSPWVADRTWTRRPFASLDALHRAMIDVVEQASEPEQLALLRAHPDLGTRARISDASTGEQRGAGLDRLNVNEYEQLRRLNDEYRRRFGFPFLFAVKGSTKEDVLTALEARVRRSSDEELAEALRQVYTIARFRLEDVIRGSSGTTG
jgi:2-oxo-4-hydroxy-4-carboxy-5-ureidoimidazoline decarboxylase